MKALEEFKAANPGRQIKIVRLDTGTDLAITADRVGAYLNANQDVNAYFDTGFWHAAIARVLRDRSVPPGKVLLGGFDLVPEVVQEMMSGYVQVQVDQQPYMQGFMPVMEAYLTKTVRSRANRHQYRQGADLSSAGQGDHGSRQEGRPIAKAR